MLSLHRNRHSSAAPASARRGAFMVLAVFCMVLTIGFVAFSVDIGMISLTRSEMQSAVDASALAAAMEITSAVENAPPDAGDIAGYCKEEAALKAAAVAELNGFYVDPDTDVLFGSRTFNEATGQFSIDWNIGTSDPANVVKVICRKENTNQAAPDAQLRLFFAGIFGTKAASLRVEATAYVEARDIVVVHDFSRSMNFDSYFSDETTTSLTDAQILDNLLTVWDDLQPVNLGSLGFTPQYLTMSNSTPNVNITFQYTQVVVTAANTLKTVRLRFTDNVEQTITATGTSGTYKGSGSNNGKNVNRAIITVSVPSEVAQSATVTQSGSPTLTFVFAADRKSVSISASSSWNRVQLKFTDGVTQTTDVTASSGTYSGTGGNSGKVISQVRVRYGSTYRNWVTAPAITYSTVYNDQTVQFDDTNTNVMACFGLNAVTYPYPSGSWSEYIDFCRTNSKLIQKGYCERFGGLTFVSYIMRSKASHAQTPALAQTKHYPFHAIKLGHSLLCDFLGDLGFNDYLGMVSYDTYHRIETFQDEAGIPPVNIIDEPLGTDYQSVSDLMAYKQAAHYYSSTNIGGGMREAITLLDTHGRTGARPNILLMTDGNANVTDGPNTLPAGWESWFNGYDGPGTTYNILYDNPTSSELSARQSQIYEVHQAVSKGYTIHTIAVGADADWRTMKAIAHYAGGEFLWVQGGQSPEAMEAQMMAAFHKIAGLVPPAKLLNP